MLLHNLKDYNVACTHYYITRSNRLLLDASSILLGFYNVPV